MLNKALRDITPINLLGFEPCTQWKIQHVVAIFIHSLADLPHLISLTVIQKVKLFCYGSISNLLHCIGSKQYTIKNYYKEENNEK